MTPAGRVDALRLAAADTEPGQWLTAGRDANGSYHSPLADINADNASHLGFAWAYDLNTRRGLEATPVVVDGTLYFSGNFGRVYAIDAASGAEKWVYDPQVDGQWGRYACCDAVNRGVAVWQGRVFVGALDGYLHAIDAATGKRLWKVDTLTQRDPQHPYTLPGAPVVAGDSVVLGTGGAEFAGVRGYVAAFDQSDGHLKWRFYTVPRDPKAGDQDQPHLVAAVKTWDPQRPWEKGSGGTVWDGLSYDPDLKLLFVGTANGAPYQVQQNDRPEGDNLFTASIVAIRADTGELAWWYQATPGNRWDYDSTQKMIFADLDLGQGPRKVLMQANKNGFLYVLDRGTGELLGAHSFAYQNWTLGLDPITHRPKIDPATGSAAGARLIFPGPAGAHSWQPMSFDAHSTLAFIPTIEQGMVWIDTTKRRAGYMDAVFNEPEFAPEDYQPETLKSLYGPLPPLTALTKGIPGPVASRGVLRAVNPISGKTLWEQPTASAWDGGVLSTDGNLVLQGDVRGMLNVYAADSGHRLTTVDLGTSVMAAPMTYKVNGTQYVAVLAGLGGANLAVPFPEGSAAAVYGNAGRLIVLKLDGGTVPKPSPVKDHPLAEPPVRTGTAAQIAQGEVLYNRYCGRCHVFGQGVLPDLRRLSTTTDGLFYDIVLNGLLASAGMARWDDVLSRSDAQAIHAYVNDQAWLLHAKAASAANP
jgi:quinohemoprotein ethanol dehydrogenase